MKKIFLLSIFFISFFQSAFAVLSPLNQSIVEIKTLLSDENLTNCLSSADPIQKIIKTDKGYAVFTQNLQLMVDVIYQPQNKPGPRPFILHFYK